MALKTKTSKARWYEEHVAPQLLALAKDCQEHGLSFLGAVDWGSDHDFGITVAEQSDAAFAFLLSLWATRAGGNVDVLLRQVRAYAEVNGLASAILLLTDNRVENQEEPPPCSTPESKSP